MAPLRLLRRRSRPPAADPTALTPGPALLSAHSAVAPPPTDRSTGIPWLAAVTGTSAGGTAINGWLVAPGDPPEVRAAAGATALQVKVDPEPNGVPGIPAGWPAWRWRVALPDGHEPGFVLTDPDGREVLQFTVTHTASGPVARGHVESPAPGCVLTAGLVVVSGWLLLDGRPPGKVVVEVDGAAPVSARLALPRPDIARGSPQLRYAGLCGYQARVGVEVPAGRRLPVVVRITAYTEDGREWCAPLRSCIVQGAAEPVAADAETDGRADRRTAHLLSRIPAAPTDGHVVIAGHSLEIAGAELWLLELVRRLIADHGYRVTVTSPLDGPLRADFEAAGADVWLTGTHRTATISGYHAARSEFALIGRTCGAAVGLANTLGQFSAVAGLRAAGIPTAWMIHESFTLADFAFQNFSSAGVAPSVLAAWRDSLRDTEELLFVSDATRELFEGLRGAGRAHTVRYGVAAPDDSADAATATRIRDGLGISEDATVLLAVGINQPRKGFGLLVRAFELAGRSQPDAHLVIVGMTTNPLSVMLRHVAETSRANIHLVDVTRDVSGYLAAADIFVNTSDVESLPRSILEAIRSGVPVLATDVFGTGELIRDGVSGWLMAPSDLTSITAGLLRALDSTPAERRHLAAAALSAVTPFLDPARYAADIADRLDSLARRAGTQQNRGRSEALPTPLRRAP